MLTLIEIALSAGVLVTLVTVLTACVCGCKNSNQKSELVGTAGVVKLRFDEEAPSPTSTTPASVKRASTQNSHRSLPEIPHPVGRHDSGDTTSEIYATVNLDQVDTAIPVASTSREHPYEHAYAKLQNESHNIIVEITPDPAPDDDIQIDEREVSQSGPESVVISASGAMSGQLPSSQELPYITPPPHDHEHHFSGDSTDSAKGYTSISVREPLSNIRAQGGKLLAQAHYATVSDDSDEMYAAIDDPSAGSGSDTYAQIVPQPREGAAEGAREGAREGGGGAAGGGEGARRSADREPRAELLPSDNSARRSAPPEMEAASVATHSRQASSSSCTNSTGALGSPKPEKRQANSPLPPPPRGGPPASAAPAVPAPPPEPRGRSPAPPAALAIKQQRISSTGDLHSGHDKLRRSLNEKHQRNNSCVLASSDFYGCNYPVARDQLRHSSGAPAQLRHSSGEITRPLVARELHFDLDTDEANLYNSIEPSAGGGLSNDAHASLGSTYERASESPARNLEEMYAKVMKKKGKDEPNRRSKELEATPKFRSDDPGYETIDRKKNSHGYETITHKERKTSQNQDPGYETVKDIHKTNNFSNNNKLNNLGESGPNSIISSSDGYEHINKIDNSASDSDPNYEVLRNQPPTPPYATIASSYKQQPTYSTVNKKPGKYEWTPNNNDEEALEPNYESMPHESRATRSSREPREPLYAAGSESDPNYESVRPQDYGPAGAHDPNYESLRLRDPKYESVRSKASTVSKDPNYESVKYFDLNREPPYEKVRNDTDSVSGVERSDSNAGYERINVANNREARSGVSNGADTVSDYFQV